MKIGRGVSELWRVENRPLPLTWPMAYTTACTTVQAVIISVRLENQSPTHQATILKLILIQVLQVLSPGKIVYHTNILETSGYETSEV